MRYRKNDFRPVIIKGTALLLAVLLTVLLRQPLFKAAAGLAVTAAAMQLPAVSLPEASQTAASQPLVLPSLPQTSSQLSVVISSETAAVKNVIKEVQLGLADGDTEASGVTLSNKTSLTPDVAASLSKDPVLELVRNGRPQVLILHTHGSEAYLPEPLQTYEDSQKWNSADPEDGVVAVGSILAELLKKAGIETVHDTTMYDSPQYTGAYDRAGAAIEKWLKKYSSIEMVIDIHRDSITSSDGTKTKPTVEIDGQKAAQVMMIVGCAGDGALPFTGWKNNLALAFRLQRQLNTDYAGLARPIYFIDRRYNMHYTKNSMLLEFGTEVNTVEEARYSAELVGKALVKVLEEF